MLTIERHELQSLLEEAARIGANRAIEGLVCYHLKDAAERLGISYNTLQKRIAEGKLRPVDGRITGEDLRRYLTEQSCNA